MKQSILLILFSCTLLIAQDAAGQYKLSGVDIEYTYITRGDVELTVTDAYGIGITIPVAKISSGVPFTTQSVQLDDATLDMVSINLNITLNEDGSGSIAEGSYYPDINTIIEDGNMICTRCAMILETKMSLPEDEEEYYDLLDYMGINNELAKKLVMENTLASKRRRTLDKLKKSITKT